jgi:RES domain-containing protein
MTKKIRLFRLALSPFADDLSGEGARLCGGRWNSISVPMIYTSTTRALAVVESLTKLGGFDLLPDNMMMVTLEVPQNQTEPLGLELLPEAWATFPHLPDIRVIGDRWAQERSSLGLYVPSAVVPQENNVIINPVHPSSAEIKIAEKTPFRFDPRLIKN